jgi:hypothetical protein
MISCKIVIWGGTGQAVMLEEILNHMNISISAIFDNNKNIKSPFLNVPMYYDKNKIVEYKNQYFVVAIGGHYGMDRVAISEELIDYGLIPIRLIHPTSYISNSSILHDGVQIFTCGENMCTGNCR